MEKSKPIDDDASDIPVDNDSLGRMIALMVHRRLFGAHGSRADRSLRELGWNDSMVEELNEMSPEVVADMFGGDEACISVVFDHRRVAADVYSYRAIRREHDDLTYFLVNGATPTLIRKLFPSASARTLAAMRKELGQTSKGGRPPHADEATTHAIYRVWQTLTTQEPSLRRRYMRLKEHFPALSLATLATAIDNR